MSEITREAFNAACEAYKGERHMVDRGAMLSALEAFVASTQPKSIDRDSVLEEADRDSVLEEAAKACAQVIADSDKNMDHELGTGFDLGCEECANAIRSLKDAPWLRHWLRRVRQRHPFPKGRPMSIAVRVFGAVALTIIMGVAVALSVAGASGFRAMSFVAVFPIIILAVCAIINWSERP